MSIICHKCSLPKDEGAFSWRNKVKKLKQHWCKVCSRKYSQTHYYNHKDNEDYQEARRKRTKQRRAQIRAFIIKAKSVPCFDCNNTYPHYVMDFDHVRGKKKYILSAIVRSGVSLKKLQEEIVKCDVVCSNCHRIRTFTKNIAVNSDNKTNSEGLSQF